MKQFDEKWRALYADQSGQDTIEYALIAGLIGLGAVASLKSLATSIGNFWNQIYIKMAPIFT